MDPISTITETTATVDLTVAVDAVASIAEAVKSGDKTQLLIALGGLLTVITPAIVAGIKNLFSTTRQINRFLPMVVGLIGGLAAVLAQGISPFSNEGAMFIVSGLLGGLGGQQAHNIGDRKKKAKLK